jgi:hypothetical protein
VTAGRDVHFNMPLVPASGSGDEETEPFADLEGTIPDFLTDLQNELSEHPLIRVVIVLDTKTIGYNWPDDHLKFSADVNPNIRAQMEILENHALVAQLRDRFAYRVSERLVKYLKTRRYRP